MKLNKMLLLLNLLLVTLFAGCTPPAANLETPPHQTPTLPVSSATPTLTTTPSPTDTSTYSSLTPSYNYYGLQDIE